MTAEAHTVDPSTAFQSIAPIDDDRLRQAGELLLAARRERTPIAELPAGLRPKTLAEAYHLQDIIAEVLGPIGGWKVGVHTADAAPICSPMPLRGGFAQSNSVIHSKFSRLRGVEAEIAYLLGKDLPVRQTHYSLEEIIDAIASAHPAIEILESAFDDSGKADHLSVTADLGMNGGFAYGDSVPGWRGIDLAHESATVIIDGVVRVENMAANPAGSDLLRLVMWLANEGQYRTGGLKEGDWITTGSWTGTGLAIAESEVIARFSSFGELRILFAA